MNMPGFDGASSLGATIGIYQGKGVFANFSSDGSGGVMPQLRFQSGPDVGAYWRCRENGGGDLICRFFAGLPPFTIGGLLM
jgi:hypothetical protein